MEYRVYDTAKGKWIRHSVYLSPEGVLFTVKRSLFGWTKGFAPESYIYHRTIDLYDRNGEMVYEGDFIKAQLDENRSVIGLVTYAYEMSMWIILCDDNTFYTLGSEVAEHIEIIGNVFDGYEEEEHEETKEAVE
jgi:hypothetical protein